MEIAFWEAKRGLSLGWGRELGREGIRKEGRGSGLRFGIGVW